jgi:formylglycine-generating enzyme required for sulfatase activity
MGQWAKAMAAVGEQSTTGIALVSQSFVATTPVGAATAQLAAKQLVRQFRSTASAKAQELADMMAVLPVNWSVIRLIQKNWADPTQEVGALQLAEIFLSGLLRPDTIAKTPKGQSGNGTQYEFVDGVRDVLLGAIPISEARAVGESIAAQIFRQLPQAVQDRVNADIAQRFGEAPSYFEAFLIPDLDWGEEAATEVFPFARVTGQVLRRWGGDYAVLAQSLEQNTWKQPGSSTPDGLEPDFPLLQVLDFVTARLVEPGDLSGESWPIIETETFTVTTLVLEAENEPEESGLQSFEFVTATVERQGGQWVIQEQLQRRDCFIEQLPLEVNITLEIVAIPGGQFRMQPPESQLVQQSREGPQREVTVPAFFMGRYPITQAQWRIVAQIMPQVNHKLKLNPSHFRGDRRPVEEVTWFDAVEFCDRLSRYTGRQYRLPSEAEWEYACRAGTTTAFHYGKTLTPELANYHHEGAYKKSRTSKSPGKTTTVGQYPANPWGLSDMHGNVWEWCADHWHSNYEGAPTDGSAWLDETAKTNARRVTRGGSWNDSPLHCRSRYRDIGNPRESADFIGFRVMCAAPKMLS